VLSALFVFRPLSNPFPNGCGARGIAHVGLLQRLEEEGYPVTSLTGTSIGALVGSLYAVGYSPREIEALFARVDFERAFLDTLLRLPGETLDEQEQRSGNPVIFSWLTVRCPSRRFTTMRCAWVA